jgi:hypothetical protein
VLVLQVIEFDESGVNLLGCAVCIEEHYGPFTPSGGLLGWSLVEGKGVILEGLVTVFHWVRLINSWEDGIVLIIKSFSGEVSDVRVFHPGDGPGVTEATSDMFSFDDIVRRAVESP